MAYEQKQSRGSGYERRCGCGVARVIVVTAVVLSPWLFGSADPWAYLFICLLVGLGVAAWLISVIHNPQVKLCAPLLTATLLALLFFVFIQMLPLSQPRARAISPLSAEAQLARSQLFEEMGAESLCIYEMS